MHTRVTTTTHEGGPVPESRPRKRLAFSSPRPAIEVTAKGTPRWWAPVMVTLMVLGLLWIVTAYITQLQWPIGALGPWNIAAGFGLALVGFAMTTRWR